MKRAKKHSRSKENFFMMKMNQETLNCPFWGLISSIMGLFILGSGIKDKGTDMELNIGMTGLFMKDIGEIVNKNNIYLFVF